MSMESIEVDQASQDNLCSSGVTLDRVGVVLVICLLLNSCNRGGALVSVDPRIDNVLLAWNSLIENDEIGDVNYRIHWRKGESQILTNEQTRYLYRSDGHGLSMYTLIDEDATYVEGINPTYTFRLRLSPSGHYLLEAFKFRNEESEMERLALAARLRTFHHAHTLKFFFHIVWPNILKSKGLKVRAWDEIEVNGETLVRLEFDVEPTEEEFRPTRERHTASLVPRIEGATVYLLKEHSYIPTTFEGVFQSWNDSDPVRYHCKVDFQELGSQLLPSIRSSHAVLADGTTTTMDEEFSFPNVMRGPHPSEFTLSAFQLPELEQEMWVTSSWVILVVIGIVSAALCLLIRILKSMLDRFQQSRRIAG